MINNVPRNYVYLIVLVLITVINTLLSRFAVVAWEIAPGVSALYFAVAFMIPLALWFGVWGIIAAYVGCVVGAGMTGMPIAVNLYWSLADLWQVLIPLIAFNKFNVDVGLRTRKAFLVFLIFGWLLNNFVGAIWGSTMLGIGGVITWSAVSNTFVGWLFGNLVVTIIITPLLLICVTPYIRKIKIAHWT